VIGIRGVSGRRERKSLDQNTEKGNGMRAGERRRDEAEEDTRRRRNAEGGG